MKKIINLLFALLLSLSIISCGSSDGGGDSGSPSVILPGSNGSTDSTPQKPSNSDEDTRTGTSSNTGCDKSTLPGCKV